MHSQLAGALLVGVVALGVGCGVGDNSELVYFHNATTLPLLVYGSDSTKKDARLVPPDGTIKDQWLVPPVWSGTRPGTPRQVQASTDSNELIFCHRFSYDELARLNWRIELSRQNDC